MFVCLCVREKHCGVGGALFVQINIWNCVILIQIIAMFSLELSAFDQQEHYRFRQMSFAALLFNIISQEMPASELWIFSRQSKSTTSYLAGTKDKCISEIIDMFKVSK